MQRLLTGKQRLPGFGEGKGMQQTELGEIPEDWEVVELGDNGLFFKGSGVKKDEAVSGSLPCVRYGEIYTHHDDYIKSFFSYISPEVASSAFQIRYGDLLFAGSGETKEDIGKCVAFVSKLKAYAGGDIVVFRPSEHDSLFLGYYLNTSDINKQKASKGQGDAVVHISSSALSSLRLCIPSNILEQRAIASVLSDMDNDIQILETRLAKTQALKQGMMQELLTGRTRLI